MTTLTRRLLLFAPVALVLLFAGAYLLLDFWLESAGGRRAVERALTERLGLPVTLQGEFDIMLLPSIGVSGTDLVLGPPGPASELGRSREYAVSLAVLPLLDGRLLIESVALSGGRIFPARLPPGDSAAPGGPASLQLPEIRSLALRDFEIVTAGSDGRGVPLQAFELEDFAAGHEAPFRLAVEGYGLLDGQLRWEGQRSALALDAAWSGLLSGQLQLRVDAALAAGSGSLQAAWTPAVVTPADPAAAGAVGEQGPDGEIRLALEYLLVPGGARLAGLRLDAAGQSAAGVGCVLLQGEPSVNLRLETALIDFDALPALPSLVGDGGGAPTGASGPGSLLNLRLAAAEARAGGAVARDAVFLLGVEPDCAALDSAAAQ
jgi:hypothetical protein